MAKLRPWFDVVKPRENRAPADYQQPERFFERTYLTQTLRDLAAQVVRRLSGERVETSAVFNMATQFGGGKTHALTLLYHLVQAGARADQWRGVQSIPQQARVASVPRAQVAVFVGTEFDSITGRGGSDGTPLRKTPWGEIAWQLGGATAFATIAQHDAERTAPGGERIHPCLWDSSSIR